MTDIALFLLPVTDVIIRRFVVFRALLLGAKMRKRFAQANKEARWAVWLTLAYALCWCLAAYLPGDATGPGGIPWWFVLSCVLVPLLFIGLCYWLVRGLFKEMPLEDDDAR